MFSFTFSSRGSRPEAVQQGGGLLVHWSDCLHPVSTDWHLSVFHQGPCPHSFFSEHRRLFSNVPNEKEVSATFQKGVGDLTNV